MVKVLLVPLKHRLRCVPKEVDLVLGEPKLCRACIHARWKIGRRIALVGVEVLHAGDKTRHFIAMRLFLAAIPNGVGVALTHSRQAGVPPLEGFGGKIVKVHGLVESVHNRSRVLPVVCAPFVQKFFELPATLSLGCSNIGYHSESSNTHCVSLCRAPVCAPHHQVPHQRLVAVCQGGAAHPIVRAVVRLVTYSAGLIAGIPVARVVGLDHGNVVTIVAHFTVPWCAASSLHDVHARELVRARFLLHATVEQRLGDIVSRESSESG
mmetsp:Transcript_3576/g.8830  ORF Transcript_3576/g.8830 Transcript_3576/m.8830 type:complete len:266 (-) Transcript_3576:878-1675(-)